MNLLRFSTTNERLDDQTRMILKKGWFSDVEIQEICGLFCCEAYTQEIPIK